MTILSHQFEVVVVKRVQNATAGTPPTFTELGRIQPDGGSSGGSGLGYGLELWGDDYISVACDPTSLKTSIADCLVDIKNNPIELHLYRDGTCVVAGPVIAWQVEGWTLILTARGMLYYTRYMTLYEDLAFTSADIGQVAVDLVDSHQDNKSYGHFGLDTSSTDVSTGKTIDREYFQTDLVNIYEELMALGNQAGGYHLTVDYDTRDLELWSFLNPSPGYGTDKRDTVIFDQRSVRIVNMSVSLAAGEFGSAVASVGNGQVLASGEEINTSLRSAFGLAIVRHRVLHGVNSAAGLLSVAQGRLNEVITGVLNPNREYDAVAGLEPVDDFAQGDIVGFSYDAGFGEIQFAMQIQAVHVSVKPGGLERINLEVDYELPFVAT